MWLPFLGLTLGVVLGSIFTFKIPIIFAKYLSVAVLASMDSVLGGFKGVLEDKFDGALLLSGFFINALMAALLAYIGDKMGVDLYYAAIFAFGVRIFNNLAVIRRHLFAPFSKRKPEVKADAKT